LKTKLLITVKTYPSVSGKYEEIVCTAGITEDGKLIRIYPLKYRELPYETQFKKYDIIEIDLVKSKSDYRPETFTPRSIEPEFKIIKSIGTEGNWRERKKLVLKDVKFSFDELIKLAKNKSNPVSLAVYKPNKILDFKWTEVSGDWDKKKLSMLQQLNIFDKKRNVIRKLPYKFVYVIEDEAQNKRTLMIEDWEIGQLYWRQLGKYEGDEHAALHDVRKKYFDEFVAKKELYLFLGTTRLNHFTSKNPFMIIGVFYPPKTTQEELSFNS